MWSTKKYIYLFASLVVLTAVVSPSAAAQNDEHTVGINVKNIVNFDIRDNVSLDLNEANGTDGVDGRHNGWTDKALSSDQASTEYSVATNREDVSITVSAFSSISIEDVKELQLAVRSEPDDEITRPSIKYVKLTEVGEAFSERTVVESLGPISKTELKLYYYGVVTPDFDPSKDGSVTITYTVTD